MPVSNSIQNFRENVINRGGGPQYASKYIATMVWPQGSRTYYPLSVVLPGRNYAFFEHDIWGPIRKIPYKRGYTQCNMTFIIYQDWEERNFIERWMNSVVLNSNRRFDETALYTEAVGTIQVKCFRSNSDQTTKTITFKEAFPAQISPAALGADATAYPTFTVGFQFNEYII